MLKVTNPFTELSLSTENQHIENPFKLWAFTFKN